MIIQRFLCAVALLPLFVIGCRAAAPTRPMPSSMPNPSMQQLDSFNVSWSSPSANSSGSMPLGNGDIGLNVWAEPNGDILLLISKTDAWSEIGRLLKLGRVRISLSPNPAVAGAPFQQELKLRDGAIEISSGQTTVRVWVDANSPVVRVECRSTQPLAMQARFETWRTVPRELKGDELASAYGLQKAPFPVIESGDTILPPANNSVTWFHRNPSSMWRSNLELQGLGEWAKTASDPLLNRTFGGLMRGEGMQNSGTGVLSSRAPRTNIALSIHALTAQTATPELWQKQIEAQAARIEKTPREKAWAAHQAWWSEFWNRSHVFVSGAPEAETVTRGYVLQRFINACAGRGAFPIKFNGSLFTVESREPNKNFDADYRLWGGPYWFQNTRLAYWPMLQSGDFDLMQPFFKLYRDALPLARERTKLFFNHEGAYFPETINFWGAYNSTNYGWDREGKKPGDIENKYIRYHYAGVLELAFIALEYSRYTGDTAFLKETALPLAREFVRFYDRHYQRREGKLHMEPAQALETWFDVVNPAPDIAGLEAVLDELLALPDGAVAAGEKASWRRLRGELPPIPQRGAAGAGVLLPAQTTRGVAQNVENADLYSVFPFRRFGVGKPELETARRTFAARRIKDSSGWSQDDTQAALLGLTDEAKALLVKRFNTKHAGSRFPAFWGPNYDWIPDQDHGGNGLMALQTMLLQESGDKIYLLPAWPKEWNVRFKLHAPQKTVVEGEWRDGKVQSIKVTPAARRADVVLPS